jgi:hypothetical protein
VSSVFILPFNLITSKNQRILTLVAGEPGTAQATTSESMTSRHLPSGQTTAARAPRAPAGGEDDGTSPRAKLRPSSAQPAGQVTAAGASWRPAGAPAPVRGLAAPAPARYSPWQCLTEAGRTRRGPTIVG